MGTTSEQNAFVSMHLHFLIEKLQVFKVTKAVVVLCVKLIEIIYRKHSYWQSYQTRNQFLTSKCHCTASAQKKYFNLFCIVFGINVSKQLETGFELELLLVIDMKIKCILDFNTIWL